MGENIGETKNTEEKRVNRKRKKTFLTKARRYEKIGRYGRGTEISLDTYQYFVRILETYKAGFQTDEEKSIFANNVLEQTANEEVNYSCNQIGCRVIETLLPFANDEVIVKFITSFDSNLRPLCCDVFASHVLEALFTTCCTKTYTITDNEIQKPFKDFTLKLSKFLLNNLEDYINDTYGNHVIRAVFVNFARIPKNEKENCEPNLEILPEYAEIVTDYCERLILWPHFKDLPYTELSSGLLQVLLRSLVKCNIKLLKNVIKKLITESFSVASNTDTKSNDLLSSLPDVYHSKSALMLLETSLVVASEKSYGKLYKKCFSGKLAVLAKLKDTNFAVQKLINCCQDKTEFETIFDELSEHFEEILKNGFTGVILSLANAAKRLAIKQGNFMQQLMKALHCFEPQEKQNSFIFVLIFLIPYENIETAKKTFFVNLHGSVITQTLLEFNKPIKLINSLMSMELNDLKQLFCDSKGSHIVDSYMKSTYVGEKSRERLIRKAKGIYQDLAATKYGSRSFEAIWNVANEKQRLHIMDELCHKDGVWSNSEFGKIIAYKLNIQIYKRNKEEWKQFIGKKNKTNELFADIIQEK